MRLAWLQPKSGVALDVLKLGLLTVWGSQPMGQCLGWDVNAFALSFDFYAEIAGVAFAKGDHGAPPANRPGLSDHDHPYSWPGHVHGVVLQYVV